MIRKAMIMKVYPDKHEEYEKRHREIWPEMVKALRNHGVINYSIFLEKRSSQLFGYVVIEDKAKWAKMSDTDINRMWWDHMKDVMETNADNSPVIEELEEVFYLD